MPPQPSPQVPQTPTATPMNPGKGSAGPTVGIIIIVILLAFGALYFWGAKLNQTNADSQLPLIPGDTTAQQ